MQPVTMQQPAAPHDSDLDRTNVSFMTLLSLIEQLGYLGTSYTIGSDLAVQLQL
jgi:hypothetical protein